MQGRGELLFSDFLGWGYEKNTVCPVVDERSCQNLYCGFLFKQSYMTRMFICTIPFFGWFPHVIIFCLRPYLSFVPYIIEWIPKYLGRRGESLFVRLCDFFCDTLIFIRIHISHQICNMGHSWSFWHCIRHSICPLWWCITPNNLPNFPFRKQTIHGRYGMYSPISVIPLFTLLS